VQKTDQALSETKDELKWKSPATSCAAVDDTKQQEPSFETALEELEQVISTMENGKVPLTELVAQFEEGSRLLKLCQSRLKAAEFKIEQLRQSPDTEAAEFEPFEIGREA